MNTVRYKVSQSVEDTTLPSVTNRLKYEKRKSTELEEIKAAIVLHTAVVLH